MLIIIGIDVLAMALDFMCVELFHYQVVVGFAKNVIIFSADMNSLVNIDNRKKDVLTLCEGPTDV